MRDTRTNKGTRVNKKRPAVKKYNASLLVKSKKVHEGRNIAHSSSGQKSRHIVETYGRKQRRISPAQRNHVWVGAGDRTCCSSFTSLALHKSQIGEGL